jgi:hypothetical protein
MSTTSSPCASSSLGEAGLDLLLIFCTGGGLSKTKSRYWWRRGEERGSGAYRGRRARGGRREGDPTPSSSSAAARCVAFSPCRHHGQLVQIQPDEGIE